MTTLLLRMFVPQYQDTKNPLVRSHYGRLGSFVGIIINVLLFILKFALGSISGSISITADAFNNLSDAGASIVAMTSFKLSSKPADSEHPFGHARIEYISAMVVAILILFLGVEVGRNAISAIKNPHVIEFSAMIGIILGLSIVVKLWLYFFNRTLGKNIDSMVLLATATDSLADTLATSAVLLSAILSPCIGIPLDGYMGCAVSLFIFFSGITIIKDAMNKLVGDAPSSELVEELSKFIQSYQGVLGVHDLVIHSYGPGKCFASIHVEVSASEDILKSHDIIDNIERDVLREKQINLVIHLDPIVTNDSQMENYKLMIEKIITEIDEKLSFHDFRSIMGDTHYNLIFDVVVPQSYNLTDFEIQNLIETKLDKLCPECQAIVTYDRSYTSQNLSNLI